MLRIRRLSVKIELDTNKYDHKVDLERSEDESWDEFIDRVAETLRELMPE